MVKIIFHTSQIDVRGTNNAVYYYAHYNETLLGNKSIITIPESSINQKRNDQIALEKFLQRFSIYIYENKEQLQKFIDDEKYDILYDIKYGKNDNFIFKNIKNCIHCVFDMTEEHGDIYAGVSEQIARKFGKTLFVPHMIGLEPIKTQENFRVLLGIPEDAIVFGRHGGQDTFNIGFCMETISRVVNDFNNIYFVFVNTPKFFQHPNIFYLDKIIKDDEKNKFISTCDAGLECGSLGHTFGLAIGEFSVNNKINIVYGGYTWNTAHKDILGNNALYFTNQDEFYNILTTFDKKLYINRDLNCYKEYTPEKIMKIFKEVFIDN